MSAQDADFGTLMAQVQEGCTEAAQKLHEVYGPHILRAVRRRLHQRLRSKYDSLDFVQDVWASFFGDVPQKYTFAQPEDLVAFLSGMAQKKVAAAYANVTPLTATFGAMDLPDGMDLVLTVQNYHDLHLKPFPADTAKKVNSEIFKSLKPGGIYLIVDHTALAGSGLEAADKIHRIDPAIVRQEVEAAGFKLESESAMLAEPSDPKTGNVFAPGIRGKTDQFIMKFRKPK